MVFSEDISNKAGLLLDRAGDFESLSSNVYKETGRTIGITTLKRLFNYIQDDRKASEYTLNTIAIYLGFDNWGNNQTTVIKDLVNSQSSQK